MTRRKGRAGYRRSARQTGRLSGKDPALSELYIVEGTLLAVPPSRGRNRKNQAILPLKGKILNVRRPVSTR